MNRKTKKAPQKLQRPKELDKRVFFCEEFIGRKRLHSHNLLWLLIHKEESVTFPWSLEFDILESASMEGSVAFSKEQYRYLVQLFESKPFNWNNRQTSSGNSIIWYKYRNLHDVVEIANQVADFAYQLHNNLEHQKKVFQLHNESYSSRHQEVFCHTHIYSQNAGQYLLISPEHIEFIVFKNQKKSTRNAIDSFTTYGYTIEEAIESFNPTQEDGVLIVNYHEKRGSFYSFDWKEMCLILDGTKITESGDFYKDLTSYPHVWSYAEQLLQELYPETLSLEPLIIDVLEKKYDIKSELVLRKDESNQEIEKTSLFSDDIDLSTQENLEILHVFKEGESSKVVVNSYERNPKARKKCIEYYGESCFVCGFNFSDIFGELGKGFIHVHHLIPISEIGEEYEINPINDMRPLCPNCHAMIHRREPLLSIDELKTILQRDKNN